MLKLHWLVWVLAIVAAALAANPTAASTPQPAPSPVAPAYLLPQYATTFESLIVNGKIIPIKGFYLASPTPKPTPSPGATPTPQSQAPPQTPSETPASAVGFNCGVDQSEPDAFNVWVGPKPCADFWTDEAGPYVRAKQFFAALGAKIVSTSDPSTQKAMFEYNRHDLMGGVFVANSPALQKIGAGQYFWPGPYHGASPANIDLFGEGLITVSYCKHTFTGPYRMNKDQTVLGKANVDPYAWALAMNYSVTYHPVMNLWSVGYLGAFPDTGLNGTDSPLYTITPSDGTYGNGTDPDVDGSYGQGTMGVTPNAKQLAKVEKEDGNAAVPFYITITGPTCGKPKKHKPYYMVHMTSTITETVNGGLMTGTVDADVAMAKKSAPLSVMKPAAMNSHAHPQSLSEAESMMNGSQGSVPRAVTAQGQGDLEYHASVEHLVCREPEHAPPVYATLTYESGAATFLLALPSGKGTEPYLIISMSKGPVDSLACEGHASGMEGLIWSAGFTADHAHDLVMPNPFSGGSSPLSGPVGGGFAIPLEASYDGSYKADISRDVKTGTKDKIHDETEITVRKCSAVTSQAFC